MSQLIQGHSVTRVAPRKSRDGTKDMWDVGLTDGNDWTTFDGATAALAANIVGQQGYTFDVSLNGKYKNLEQIIAPGGALPAQAVAPGTTLPAGAQVNSGAPTSIVGDPQSANEKRMSFYGALKNAVQLVSSLYQGAGPEAFDQAVDHVKAATERFQAGARAAEQTELPVAAPTTPTGVVEAVNAEAGAEVVQTGAQIAW